MLRKLKSAVEGRDEHIEEFYDFTDTLPAASIFEWTSAVEGWEKQNGLVNPFVSVTKSKPLLLYYLITSLTFEFKVSHSMTFDWLSLKRTPKSYKAVPLPRCRCMNRSHRASSF